MQDVDVVINYDKPISERLFIHRVGRTARCGKPGTAISLTTSGEVECFLEVASIDDSHQDF